MKKGKMFLGLVVLLTMVLFPQMMMAEVVENETFEAGNGVTYYYTYDTETNEATITNIVLSEDATEIELVIPEMIGDYTVSGVALEYLDETKESKIKSIAFAGSEIPMIYGNLYSWRYNSFIKIADLIESNASYSDVTVPDTDTALQKIPAYITTNYNYDSNGDSTNDAYYVGANLVRVSPDYAGDLIVKDGTVSILAGAMEGCTNLGKVTLPDSVEWIGVRAFANSGVTSINIPNGLLTHADKIQMWTFYGCKNLTTITFPEGTATLGNIGYMAFMGCEALTGFDFTRTEKIETLSFAKAFVSGTVIDLSKTDITPKDTTYFASLFSHSGIGKVILGGSGNATIPFETFRNCTSLREIVWADTVQKIDAWAFSGCTSLTYDVLKDSKVNYLEHRSFADTGMTEVTIPESVTTMWGGVFAGNEQLEIVNWKMTSSINTPLFAILNDYPKGTYYSTPFAEPQEKSTWSEYTQPTTINIYAIPTLSNSQYYLFAMLPYLETVNFCCEVTKIEDYMFQFCPSLKEVTFAEPEKITTIGNDAFVGCSRLKDFAFDKLTNLETIGNRAFMVRAYAYINADAYATLSETEKGYGLTSVDLSNCTNLTSIGTAAFFNQYNVTSAHIPASVTSMGQAAFHGTVSMKTLSIEGSVWTNVIANSFITSEYTKGYNSNLETITIGGEITPVEGVNTYSLFYRMSALKTVNLTNATVIFPNAFLYCEALETVEAPNAISVSKDAFNGNTALKTLKLPEVTTISNEAFLNCTALRKVEAPNVTNIGDAAFMNTGIREVLISKDITYGNNVFQNCTALEKVVVEEGVTALTDFMFEGTTALKTVELPSTLETIGWGTFKNSKGCMIDIPASVKVIEDDAFVGNAFLLVFNGTPEIKFVHSGYSEDDLNEYAPISASSTLYYTNDAAQTTVETYVASLGEEEDKPKVEKIDKSVHSISVTSRLIGTDESVAHVSMNPSNGSVKLSESVTVTAPNMLSYTFKGWYASSDIIDNQIREDAEARSTNYSYSFVPDADTELVAVYETVETASATIFLSGGTYTVSVDDGEPVAINDIYEQAIPVGSKVTISVTDESFMNWLNENQRIVTTDKDYTFTVLGDLNLTMSKVSVENQSAMVAFVSEYNQVIASKIYDANTEIEFPDGPSKMGYTFTGWNLTQDEIYEKIAAGENYIKVMPVYEQNETKYTITVWVDGDVSDTLSMKDVAAGEGKIVYAPEVEGRVFLYWTDENDNILGYDVSYGMIVNKNIIVKAVYGDVEIEKKPVIAMTNVFTSSLNNKNKLSFTATRDIPEGYTLIEHGILYRAWNEEHAPSEESFVFGETGMKKYVSADMTPSGVFTLNINITGKESVAIAARGYMIVKHDVTGQEEIYYTNISCESYDTISNE